MYINYIILLLNPPGEIVRPSSKEPFDSVRNQYFVGALT